MAAKSVLWECFVVRGRDWVCCNFDRCTWKILVRKMKVGELGPIERRNKWR